MPTTASISDVQSTEVSPGALSALTHILNPAADGLDDVTLLVAAAEAFARRSIRELPGVGLGGRVRDEFICMECQRGSRASGVIEHSTRCDVGKILTLCVGMRGGPGMSLAQAEFARGVAHGEARQLARQLDAIAVPASEQASAVRTLELVTGTGITLTPERAAQIQREFDNAARRVEEPDPVPSGGAAEVEAAFNPAFMVLIPRNLTPQMFAAAQKTPGWIVPARLVPDMWDALIAAWDAQKQEAVDLHDRLESAAPIAPLAEDVPERRVVCGRAIQVSGHADKDVFTCDRDPGHGAAGCDETWHHDSTVSQYWTPEVTEIRFHPSGMVERRLFGGKLPEFDYTAANAVDEVAR